MLNYKLENETSLESETSLFEIFKTRVAEQVRKNLCFNFIHHGTEYTTLDQYSQKKIAFFIKQLLNRLDSDTSHAIENLDTNEDLDEVIHAVAGSGIKDKQINLSNGFGLHFTGLTKLCFDAAQVLHKKPMDFFNLQSNNNIPAVLHISDYALARIVAPIDVVMQALETV
ncbi:MAG: hypothetical protein ACHQJ6_05015 [Candidatus Berkiellales bacterium]